MPFSRIGGLAALVCAGTYMIGFALLVTWLAPLHFGNELIDPDRVAALICAHPHAPVS